MSVVTAASTHSIGGLVDVFKFTSVDDADTFEGPESPVAYWAMGTGDPSTQASAGVAIAESSGTYTFHPGEDSLACTLFVVRG